MWGGDVKGNGGVCICICDSMVNMYNTHVHVSAHVHHGSACGKRGPLISGSAKISL